MKFIPSLYETYRSYFPIGAAVSPAVLTRYKQVLDTHFNSVTAENHMKFGLLHPEEDRYNFAPADEITDYAQRSGKLVRGHTLVWHNQTSDWIFKDQDHSMASRQLLLERMRSHIHTVMNRYKGKVYAWDVVNEAVIEDGEQILRDSGWLKGIGPNYVKLAFDFAHDADPKALLFYNDYNETHPVKRKRIADLLKSLLEQGTPVHGMGMQGHWGLESPSLEDIRAAIELYAGLGLNIQITELDVSLFTWNDRRTDLLQPELELLERQAARYESLFRLFLEYREVITGVTFWGVADDYTWLDDFPIKGRKNWPLLFDEQLQPKEAFWPVIEAAQKREL